jgi:hypothetical protein
VKIFAIMKESETAPILELMARDGPVNARRVALISERLRLLSPPPTQEKTNKAPNAAPTARPAASTQPKP